MSETHPEHTPNIYGLVSEVKGFTPLEDLDGDSLEAVLELAEGERLIIKPKTGFSGGDVHSLSHDGKTFYWDEVPIPRQRVLHELQSLEDSLIMEFVEGASYAQEISSESGNTIRALTFIHPDSGEAFLSTAIHWFGTAESGAADNWSQGGLSVAIDQETGTLGEAATSPKGTDFGRMTTHPDTGKDITGVEIPAWDKIQTNLLNVANEMGHLLRYVGWDIIVTDDEGSFKIVEANSGTDVDLIQTHDPLLADRKTREFFDHYGIL